MIDPAFDGHPTRAFADMSAEERLDDLSNKIALVLELRKSRVEPEVMPASKRGEQRQPSR
jgi:hypothetical protein